MYGVHYILLLSHYTSTCKENMKFFLINEEISDKLRELVNQKFQTRGRFKELESLSGIGASKWKNFLYKKQEATQELINFWADTYQDYDFPISQNADFSFYAADREVSERLRTFVEKRFQTRGRFTLLESVSGIKANKWKNFYYGKQLASQELLQFWFKKFPDTQNWILTDNIKVIEDDYPHVAFIPDLTKLNISDRLIWAINEWIALDGQQLFDYLARRSSGKISAKEWGDVIQRAEEPTLAMLSVVCETRPEFTEWIVCGHAGHHQKNPFNTDEG